MGNSKYTAEWFQQEAAKINEHTIEKLKQEAQDLRNEFMERYAPEKLKQLSGLELLRRMFYNDEKDNNNLSYWLEKKTRSVFGSISGGSAYKFGIFYRKSEEWVSGNHQNGNVLSVDNAVQEAGKIRDQLLSACEILNHAISSNKSFDDIETYKNLNAEFLNKGIDIIRLSWVRKYLFVCFYDKDIFPNSYSKGYLRNVLKEIGEPCNEEAFVMMGYLKILGNSYGIPTLRFGTIISDIYKSIKSSQGKEDDDDRHYWLAGCTIDRESKFNEFVKNGMWFGRGEKENDKTNKLIQLVSKDDVIILKKRDNNNRAIKIYAVGYIKSKAVLEDNYYHINVDYVKIALENPIEWNASYGNTFHACTDDKLISMINNLLNEDYYTSKMARILENAHNLILTGAPGTGKTYLANEIAKEMDAETEFVQFHPSYDYTDFVEGLRPTKDDSESEFHFARHDGIFKQFCRKAVENLRDSAKTKEIFQKENQNKERLMGFLEDACQNRKKIPLKSGNNEFKIEAYDGDKVMVTNKNEITKRLTFNTNELLELLNEFDSLNNVNDIKKYYQRKYVYQTDSYKFALYHEIKKYKYTVNDNPELSDNKKKNFVFIIDEINRGELSKIFGELFFAIDPDYRVNKEEIEDFIQGNVKRRFIPPKTQYQNLVEDGDIFAHGFFIPENLYILGTMNDIDRSVESMDFAIRRRFNWMEIQPEEFCDQMWQDKCWADDAKRAMKAINDIIKSESNLGAAYQIGPAYFLKLDKYEKDQDDIFASLWENNLEPLICEYLRGIPDKSDIISRIKDAYYKAINEQESSEQE